MRFDEAFPEIEKARQLDPLLLIIASDYGAIFYFSRQYDRAIEQFRTVLEMEPDFPRAHMLVWAYAQKGLFADALADAEETKQPEPYAWGWAMTAYAYGRATSQSQVSSQTTATVGTAACVRFSVPFTVVYIGIGDTDKAIASLQKAFAEHSNDLTALKVDPIYDLLPSDPALLAPAAPHRAGAVTCRDFATGLRQPTTAQRVADCRSLFPFDIHHVDDIGLRVQITAHLDLLADELARQSLVVQMIDILSGNQHELAAQPLDAIHGTGGASLPGSTGL